MKLLLHSAAVAVALLLAAAPVALAQTPGVGIGTTTPDASAVLDLTSTAKGLLAPRLTSAQRTAIASPAQGLLVFQTDGVQPGFWYYNSGWLLLPDKATAGDNLGNHTATQNLNLGTSQLVGNGGTQGLRLSSSGQVGIGGVAPTNWLDIQGEGRVGTHPTGRPLYITGGFDQAANGVEIRHSNATQGVGIGYNSLYAAGSNPNQNLNLLPKGTGSTGIGTIDPAASALVDMTSSTKGALLPRLTQAQRDAIQSPASGLTLYNINAGRLNTYNGYAWTEPVLNVPPGTNGQLTFNFTGSSQTFTVPRGVTSLQVDMAGAQGYQSCPGCYPFPSGSGGRVQATLAVTPGQVLTIEVGGSISSGYTTQPGGYNGGGGGASPGGGATDIRIGGTALTSRVLVAGGGGGAFSTFGRSSRGGAGGGLVGGNGSGAGTGGTQSTGGQDVGVPFQYCYCSPSAAGLGVGGGVGGGSYYSAGGGGGYYGGGAGYDGAGGGGSSYADPALATSVIHTQGYRGGNGYAIISFTQGPEAPNLSLSNATVSQAAGSVIYSDGTKLAGNAAQLYWDNAGTRLGIGTNSPQAKLHVAGLARIDGLAGAGTRMVMADATGNLSAQPVPDNQQLSIAGAVVSLTNGGSVTLPADNDNQQLSIAGLTLGISGGNTVTLPAGADNLGNHTATQNLNLGTNQLLGNGGSQGLSVLSGGGLLLPAGVIQRGGPAITATGDLGLYSRQNGSSLRLVTNAAPIRFYSDDDAGGTANVSIESTGNVGIGTGNGTPANRLDIQTEARNGPHASGRALYVTGNFGQADTGVEFRHSNGTQGIGFGFNSLYAAGSNPNQDLNLVPKGTGRVGIGTTSPNALLDVNGSQFVRDNLTFGTGTKQTINLYNGDYGIGVQGGTQYFRSGQAFAWYVGGTHDDSQFSNGGGITQMVLKNSFLGVGAGYTTNSGPSGPLEIRRDNASPYIVMHDPNDAWFSFGMDFNDGRKIKINDGNGFGSGNLMTLTRDGYIGMGTTSPAFPLDVQGSTTPANFNYGYLNGNGNTGYGTNNTGPVSIRATGRVLASEFNATSDRRLKTVIGLSDNAADLGLLNQIRITDYTMRDRVQYGERRFKKVIAQEVEEIFPQAVNQHLGFLPDVYANAVSATAEGDSLLRLTLPKAPATAAKAGQHIKLIGAKSEVTGTVARAATGTTLLVRGAKALAGQPVFVFGLEHADVRTVDYEALAMLNVSATQELARQVAELQKQNAALRTAQSQATADTRSLAQRLAALENMLDAKASK